MKKIIIKPVISERLRSFDIDELSGNLEDVITMLKEMFVAYPYPKFTKLRLKEDYNYEYSSLDLMGDREETDVEQLKRLKEDRIRLEKQRKNLNKKKDIALIKFKQQAKKMGFKVEQDANGEWKIEDTKKEIQHG